LTSEGLCKATRQMKPHLHAVSAALILLSALTFGYAAHPANSGISHNPNGQSNVQFVLTTSSDDLNVYGNASLTEQVQSDTSYKITITVTSPSGRTNTTESDWSPAPVTFSGGLSFGFESGNYQVEAKYTGRTGTYDQYGNFSPTGAKVTGSATETYLVRPIISIVSVQPSSIIFDRLNQIPRNATAMVAVGGDLTGFPNPIYITMSLTNGSGLPTFYEVSYPLMSGNPRYRHKMVFDTQQGLLPVTYTFTASFADQRVQTSLELFMLGSVWKKENGVFVELIEDRDYKVGTRIMNLSLSMPAAQQGGGGGGGGQQPDTCFCAGSAGLIPPGSGVCAGNSIPACPQGSFNGGSPGVCCWYNSPILLDIDGNGFNMTSNENGVLFDVSGRDYSTRTSWTTPNSDDAWLVLDRNQNGRIDDGREMFGDACPQPAGQAPRNGFSALALFDQANFGGNGDGKITRRDQVFKKLRLWQDRNHNGISEAEELSTLPALDVVAIRLDYSESQRTDIFGNKFKYWTKVRDRADARVGRRAWDVFLVVSPPGN